MSESYVECLVKGKPDTLAKVGRVFLIAGAVVLGLGSLLIGSMVAMIIAIAFGVGAYYVGMLTNIEYEYLYLDKEVTVDKVYNQTRRKRVAVYTLERMEVFAPIKSYHLENFGRREGKAVDYSIGYEEQPDRRYVMYYEGGQKILFSPSEEFVKAMKNASPRKVFTD